MPQLPSTGKITSTFGFRKHPITGKWVMHNGIDFGINVGTPVFAVERSMVVGIGYNEVSGNWVKLRSVVDSDYTFFYFHLSEVLVVANMITAPGVAIAKSGNTGAVTGPHLHFEVHYKSQPTDPQVYLNSYSKEMIKITGRFRQRGSLRSITLREKI